MERTGQTFDGRYRLRRLLGQGGMAAVYAALDVRLDKAVAVKVLSPEYASGPRVARRFMQEARAVSLIRHPNVIDITDFGVAEDGAAYLVMELLRGEDLSATLAREGPLPWTRALPIALQICAALEAAHRVGVIHRDIKPSNCFRVHAPGNPDFIKVLDFGIARVLDPDRRVAEPTTAGTLLGTPEYMAPEVAAGGEAGPSADLYAVGALVYRLLTGVPPFVGDSFQAVLSKQIFEPPIPPRRRARGLEIPEAVDALVLRALAKDPAERPADMLAFAVALADALPDRPAVEKWIDVPPGEATRSLVAAVPDVSDPATAPLATSRPATVPLAAAPMSAPTRRAPLALAGVAVVLAGAALALALGRPPVIQDMSERAGPIDPDPRDTYKDDRTASSPVERSRGDGPAPAVPSDARALAGGPAAPASPAARQDVSESPPAATPEPSAVVSAPGSSGAPDMSPGTDSARAAPVAAGPRRERPRFDEVAARREIRRYAREIQRCAVAADMLRGDLRVVFTVDGAGRIAAVEGAPGARRVEPAALACIRRELVALRLAPTPGAVVEDFAI